MVSVASLLNPTPSPLDGYGHLPSPCSSRFASEYHSSPTPGQRKQKMTKDAAVFSKGKIKGVIRYPPHEDVDEELAAQYDKFSLYPIGKIMDFCRRIPYNSEKKSFTEKTGRESFEVFQYTFMLPGEDREYTVMWDYNVGLVRITSFFKCCKYSKTTPAKMLNQNHGLRDITHSITGGALAAQGYWMPFEAAKAVAATFCFHIRYALVPLFGADFLRACVVPEDPRFGRMVIDREIIRTCAEAAREYRILSREGSMVRSPGTPDSSAVFPRWTAKALRPKPVRSLDMDSSYGTDTDRSDRYMYSPQTSTSSEWTALNTPRSAALQHYHLPSSYRHRAIPAIPEISEDVPENTETSSSEDHGCAKRTRSEIDEDYDEESSAALSSEETASPKRRKRSAMLSREARAAYVLMQLSMADASLKDDEFSSPTRRNSL